MSRPQSIQQLGKISNELRTINACIYSHPGEGKTPLWGSGGDSVLLMDSDHGIESAEADGSNSYYASVTDYDDLETIYEFVKHDMKKEMPSVRWVVWDSITLFQDRALMDDIMPDTIAENPRQEEFVPSRREYLINMNKIMRYVRQFVELPINFGVSAHVMMEVDPKDNSTIHVPQVQGKNMPSKLCGYMNVIGYLGTAHVGKEKIPTPRLLTQRVGKYYARVRFKALGKHVDNPTLPKIEKLIEARRKELAAGKPATVAKRVPVRRRRPTSRKK